MCGRVNVSDNEGLRHLLGQLGMETWPSRDPRYNIAPTQTLDVVVLGKESEEPGLMAMDWGLSMSMRGKTGKMVNRTVSNARDDKLWSSRLWKPLIETNRALVPINGFYEWQREGGKPVQAWHMTPAGQSAMFLAGLYRWPKADDVNP